MVSMMSQHNILKRLTILAATLVVGISSSNAQQISPADQEYFDAMVMVLPRAALISAQRPGPWRADPQDQR